MSNPKTYVLITELEFDTLLKASKGWTKEYQYEELVYLYSSTKNPDIQVKVFSSLTRTGVSRKCGGDAIRVCAINTKTNRGIAKSKRVNRIAGWEDRIKARVIEIINKIW